MQINKDRLPGARRLKVLEAKERTQQAQQEAKQAFANYQAAVAQAGPVIPGGQQGIVRIADHYYKEFTVERVTVYACKMAGDKVLAKTVWPGEGAPLIVLPLDESIICYARR